MVGPRIEATTAVPGGRSEASKLTAADGPLANPVGSVAVAVMVSLPLGRPAAGAHDHEPESVAVPVHSAVEPSFTVTDASGSDVPEIEESSVRV